MDGEIIERADPHIGLLHRATEKLAESKPYNQSIGYMDRLDYVSMMCNEHGYVNSHREAPRGRASVAGAVHPRVVRRSHPNLNHLMWLGAHGLDIGAMTVFLYCFREREDLMDCYEAVSGTRMHARTTGPAASIATFRRDAAAPSGAGPQRQASRTAERRAAGFAAGFPRGRSPSGSRTASTSDETLLTENRIWKQRTVGIGVVSPERAVELGFSGPMLRGSGVEWDLRKKQPYEVYDRLDFDVPVGVNGDCYDRYLVRIEEMRQSNRIVRQCVEWLRANAGPVMLEDYKLTAPTRRRNEGGTWKPSSITSSCSRRGIACRRGRRTRRSSTPSGEFGVYLVSDGANKPYRLKVRAPGFAHLAAMNELIRGHMLADVGRDHRNPRRGVRGDRSLMPQSPDTATLSVAQPMTLDEARRVLNEHTRHEIDDWLTRYPPEQRRSAVLAALREAQHQNRGYLTEELMDAVAAYLDLPPIWV